tara:strand:- start:3374 stop:3871 length:498 start_codon:yes stop_codon:yes gene_type:complete
MTTQSETTLLSDLPNNYQSDNVERNSNSQYYNSNVQLETSDIPQRDVPTTTSGITTDSNTKVNFLPDTQNEVYYVPQETSVQGSTKSSGTLFGLDSLTIEDLRVPFIVGLLFIIFQSPTVTQTFKSVCRFAFDDNDNMTQNGVYVLGGLFAIIFMGLTKGIEVLL